LKRRDIVLYALLAVYAILPWVPGVGVTTAGLAIATGLAAIGLALLMGHAGLVSFGHGFFYAIGAYTVAMVLNDTSLHEMLLLLPLAVIASLAVAALVGPIVVRHRGVYFAMITLTLGQLLYGALLQFYDITGGSDGLPVTGYTVAGVSAENLRPYLVYYVGFVLLALVALGYRRLLYTPFAHILRAARDDEHRVVALGVKPSTVYYAAFILSAGLAGLGGAIHAFIVEHVTPQLSYWEFSGELAFIALLGGVTGAAGPLLGSLVYQVAYAELYQYIPEYWRMTLGALLLVIIFAAAGGLEGLLARLRGLAPLVGGAGERGIRELPGARQGERVGRGG